MPTPFTSAVKPPSLWRRVWNWLSRRKPPIIQDLGPDFAGYSRDELERLRQAYCELLGADQRFVLYRNGTCVRLSAEESLSDADEKLQRFGQIVVGTPLGDFAVDRRASGHLTTFHHPDILVLVPHESLPSENEAMLGFHGRMCRHVDAIHREVVGTTEALLDR
jgi:hypothetical protein